MINNLNTNSNISFKANWTKEVVSSISNRGSNIIKTRIIKKLTKNIEEIKNDENTSDITIGMMSFTKNVCIESTKYPKGSHFINTGTGLSNTFSIKKHVRKLLRLTPEKLRKIADTKVKASHLKNIERQKDQGNLKKVSGFTSTESSSVQAL